MKLETTLDRKPGMLHLIPLLDLMIVLSALFFAGSTLVQQSGVEIKLPTAASALPPLSASRIVSIAAGPDRIFLDESPVTFEGLASRLDASRGRRQNVILKADRRAPDLTWRVATLILERDYALFLLTSPKDS